MLARVAENLYWIGRYIERSEHCSRYLKVQFFSTLDAPMLQNKDFTLRSIMFMAGVEFDHDVKIKSEDVWRRVIFDVSNPSSLFSIAYKARENARSIRNNISTELWESINKWYLYYKAEDREKFGSKHIYDFTTQTSLHIAIMKSTLDMTLLHNDVWRFLKLGMYMERGFQILRILKSKISDSRILSDNGANIPLMRYQWITLLKCIEGLDMYNQYYRGTEMTEDSIFEFILANNRFPRSFAYTLLGLEHHLSNLSIQPLAYPEVLAKFDNEKKKFQQFDHFGNVDEVLQLIDEAYKYSTNFNFDIERLYYQ